MSTHISPLPSAIAAMLDISLLNAVYFLLIVGGGVALLVLFTPLLRGIWRALMLVIRPKLSREERSARRHMHDGLRLNRMPTSPEAQAPVSLSDLRSSAAK